MTQLQLRQWPGTLQSLATPTGDKARCLQGCVEGLVGASMCVEKHTPCHRALGLYCHTQCLLCAQPGLKSTIDMKSASFHVTNSIPLDFVVVFKICYLSEPVVSRSPSCPLYRSTSLDSGHRAQEEFSHTLPWHQSEAELPSLRTGRLPRTLLGFLAFVSFLSCWPSLPIPCTPCGMLPVVLSFHPSSLPHIPPAPSLKDASYGNQLHPKCLPWLQ